MHPDLATEISVIIPVFNAERFIGAALESVSCQQLEELEVLVVDDCSTDGTRAIVQSARDKDPRIRLMQTPVNQGPASARNIGINAARGTWIALLDADDTFSTGRLSSLLDLARTHDADMVSDNIMLVQADGLKPPQPMISPAVLSLPQNLSLAEFVKRNIGDPKEPRVSYGFMKPMIKRQFLNEHSIRYDGRVRFAEDFALYVRCLSAGAIWWITPEAFYNYVIRSNSLTEVQTSHDLDILRSTQRTLLLEARMNRDAELTSQIRRHLRVIDRSFYYRAFTDALKRRQAASALRVLFSAPESSLLIAAEAGRQLPTIVRKLKRGGYSRKYSSRV